MKVIMKVFNKFHLVTLLSLLFWLQDLDAQKRGGDEAAVASSSTAMIDDSDGESDFPLFEGFREICGSFLDKGSRAALWDSSSTVNGRHNAVISSLKFDEQTPSLVMLSKAGKCPCLEALDMSECVNDSPAVVQAIVQRCPLLKKLNLRYCRGSAGFVEGLAAGVGEQLEELDLLYTDATAAQVREIVQRCPRLKMLHLYGCPGVAGFVEGLAEGAGQKLEELDLWGTDATAAQVRAIVQRCPRLKKLNLGYCVGSAEFIEELAVGVGEQLEELNLQVTGATAGQVRAIVQHFPQLKKLNLWNCRGAAEFIEGLEVGAGEQLEELTLWGAGATAAQVAALRARFPRCKISGWRLL